MNGPYTFGMDFASDFQLTVPQPTEADATDLVLAVAKASNFNVNVQGRTNGFRTQYRLRCNLCKTDMDLGTRSITKAEIENPVTDTSKFCVEHAHTVKVKAAADGNYRKFREE